jgi:hypothetical protein
VSHIGAEYGWGTVRPNLIRGIGRWQYTIAKLILLALLAAGSLLVVVAATVVSSLIARGVAPPPAQFASATTWAKTSGVLLKSWTGLIPFIAFAGFATVLTRSTAAGMIISIGYRLAEGVIVGILGAIFSWVATLSHYLLGQNIEAWAGLSFPSHQRYTRGIRAARLHGGPCRGVFVSVRNSRCDRPVRGRLAKACAGSGRLTRKPPFIIMNMNSYYRG